MSTGIYGRLAAAADEQVWRRSGLGRFASDAEGCESSVNDAPAVVSCDAATRMYFDDAAGSAVDAYSASIALDALRMRPTFKEIFLQTGAPRTLHAEYDVPWARDVWPWHLPSEWGVHLATTEFLPDTSNVAPDDQASDERDVWRRGRAAARKALRLDNTSVARVPHAATTPGGAEVDIVGGVRWLLMGRLYVAHARTPEVSPVAALVAALGPDGRVARITTGHPACGASILLSGAILPSEIQLITAPLWTALAMLDDHPENRDIIPMSLLSEPRPERSGRVTALHKTLVVA